MAREKKNNSRESKDAPVKKLAESSEPPGIARFVYPALIVVFVGIAFSNALRGPFILDEALHILKNEEMKTLWPPWISAWAFTQKNRPVVGFSLAVNYAISGYEVVSWHLFNIGAHALAALALYGVLWRTFKLTRMNAGFEKSEKLVAFAATALWAVHPLNTQPVNYVIQRSEVLMALFFLLTLYCVIRASTTPGSTFFSAVWYGLGLLSCVLGMGCKEVMIAAPVTILIYDLIFLGPERKVRGRSDFAMRIPFYVLLFASGAIIYILHQYVPLEKSSGAFATMTKFQYAQTEFGVVLHYLRLAIVPWPLIFDYGWPVVKSATEWVPQMLAIIALVGATFWALVKRPPLGFAGLWFFLILGPTSTIFPINDTCVEHRMYLPLAAPIAIAVALCRYYFSRLVVPGRIALGITLAAYCALTLARNVDYRSEIAIWQDTMEKAPKNNRAIVNLASALNHRGKGTDIATATALYQKALERDPNYLEALSGYAHMLDNDNKHDESVKYFEKALQVDPDSVEALSGLGNVLAKMGKPAEAFKYFDRALKINPRDSTTHNLLGATYGDVGRTDDAIREYQIAIQLNPRSGDAYNNLGAAYAQRENYEEAKKYFTKACEVKADYAEAYANLGLCHDRLNQPDQAEFFYLKALGANPNYRDGHFNYGLLLQKQGKLQAAAEQFEIASQLRPDDANVHKILQNIYLKLGRTEDARRHGQFLKR